MPYSRVQLLEALRTDHPEFRNVDDNKLFAALAVDHPDIAKGISELQAPVSGPQSDNRTAGEVALDQMDATSQPVRHPLNTLREVVGGIVSAAGNPGKQLEMINGTVAPFATVAKGGAALLADASKRFGEPTPEYRARAQEFPEANPSNLAWPEAAQSAGANLALTTAGALPESPMVRGAVKAGAAKVLPSVGDLRKMAASNKAKALGPKSLESQAAAQSISPEIAERGMARGRSGKAIDANVMAEVNRAGTGVAEAENRLTGRTQYRIERNPILGEIDQAIQDLHVGEATGHPEAVSKLRTMRAEIAKLPEVMSVDDAIRFRRSLDKAVEDAGGFKQSSTSADRMDMTVRRGVADMFRRRLNGIDEGLATANHDFWLARKAADIVQRRELGEVGKITSGLPGRGSILDDILATTIGTAVGGPAGGAVAEAANLARQSRIWANVKSGAQSKLANVIEGPKAKPGAVDLPDNPNALRPGRGTPAPGDLPRDAAGQIIWKPDKANLTPGTMNPGYPAGGKPQKVSIPKSGGDTGHIGRDKPPTAPPPLVTPSMGPSANIPGGGTVMPEPKPNAPPPLVSPGMGPAAKIPGGGFLTPDKPPVSPYESGYQPEGTPGRAELLSSLGKNPSGPNLLATMAELEGSNPGAPIPMRSLLEKFGSQEALDTAIKEARDRGDIYLAEYSQGYGTASSLTPAEIAEKGLVNIRGKWYVAASRDVPPQ